MTKKELTNIVEGITNAVLLRLTATDPDTGAVRPETYEPTASDQDEARTLVGIALKRNRAAILAAIPVFSTIGEAAPVAAPVVAEPVSSLVLPS